MGRDHRSSLAQALEEIDEVVRYVKNYDLSFAIPHTLIDESGSFTPDFIACIDDGRAADKRDARIFVSTNQDEDFYAHYTN